MRYILGILLILSLIVLVSGCTTHQSNITNDSSTSNVSSRNNELKITDPVDGSTVSKIYTVKGTVPTLKSGEKLYVLVKSGNYTWWVQQNPTVSNGNWECIVQFGENEDSGREFTVCALVTTETLTTSKEYGADLPNLLYKDDLTVKKVLNPDIIIYKMDK